MNEYQQKAEQYVRGQLPELMELSFGCALINTSKVTEFYDGLDWIVRSLATFDHMINASVDDDLYEGLIDNEIDIEECKIIGHPIQLQHWLRVLPSARETNLLRDIETNAPVLDVWTENTGIQFNLTTGQPATEKDYKAFCEIVGI